MILLAKDNQGQHLLNFSEKKCKQLCAFKHLTCFEKICDFFKSESEVVGEKWKANHAMWQSVGEEWKVWVKSKPTWRKSRLKCGWKVKSVGKTNPGADKSHLSIGGRQICQTCVSPKILSMTKIYPRNMKGKFPHWVFHSYFYHWKATRLLQCQTNNVNFKTLDLVLIAWILKSKFLHWGMPDLSRMHFLKKWVCY